MRINIDKLLAEPSLSVGPEEQRMMLSEVACALRAAMNKPFYRPTADFMMLLAYTFDRAAAQLPDKRESYGWEEP